MKTSLVRYTGSRENARVPDQALDAFADRFRVEIESVTLLNLARLGLSQ
jgi:hypothetical protein